MYPHAHIFPPVPKYVNPTLIYPPLYKQPIWKCLKKKIVIFNDEEKNYYLLNVILIPAYFRQQLNI